MTFIHHTDATLNPWIEANDHSEYGADLPSVTVIDGRIGVWVPALDNRDAIVGGHFEPAAEDIQVAYKSRAAYAAALDRIAAANSAVLSDSEPF